MKVARWILAVGILASLIASYVLTAPDQGALGQTRDASLTGRDLVAGVPITPSLYLPMVQKPPATPTPLPPTPLPSPTSTPTPSPTSTGGLQRISDPLTPTQPSYIQINPNPAWYIPRLHQLTCEENHGMLRLSILVLDWAGNPVNGVPILVNTMDGNWPSTLISGDKGPGLAEYSFETSNHTGGRWKAEIPGGQSDIAMNLATDLPDDPTPGCNGGNTRNHYSYDVTFRRVP